MNSNSAVKPDDGGKLMIDEFQAMRQQMAQLLDVIAVQQQQNIGLASRMEELSKQVHANSQISPPPSPIPQNSQDEASAPMKVMMDEVAVPALKQQLLEEDVDLDEIKRRSEQLANLLLAKGISPPASLLSITPPPSLPSADPQPIPEEGKMADVTAVNRPARPGAPPEPNPPQIPTSKPEAKNPTMKWKPSPKSVVVASTPQSQDATVNPQRNDWTPSANPVLRRIATARRWQDLQALVDRQPKGLDAVAVASAFTRLPSLLKSYEIDQEVNDFASQLLQLLQLQLQSLPNSSLASVLGACSSIPGVSASHPSWLTGAVRAVAIKMKRMTLSEISGCLLGLNSLGAEPNEEWTAELLKEVQLRLKADGSVALEDLGLVLRSIADIRSETKPDASWMKDFEATCTSLSATFQPSTSSLKGIVGLIIGSHKLKSDLDPDMYIAALKTALGLTGSPSALNQAIQLLQTSLTAQELVDLTSGIASPQSDPSLLSAIAEATWPKLSQLSAATSLTLFDTLVAARYDFPPAMLASFSNRLTSSESLDLMSSGDIVALLSTLASISSSSLQPSSLETVQDVMMTKGLGLAKSTSRLDPDTLTSLLSSLSCLGAAVKPSLLTAVFRDIRPQLKSLQPSTFSLMASSLGRLEVNIDIDFVEAVVEDLMERAMELDVLTGSPTSVVLINGLASMNVKPRSSLLGPLLASTMDTAPLLPPADIISLLNAIASLKLKREETQGVLKATSPGGSPSPQDFVSCLLSSLKSSNFDLLTVKQVASIASHLKALSDPLNGSARHSPPPPEWTNEFLSSFSRKLNGASTDSIVLILSTLPSLSKGQGHAVPEGFVRACLSHIEASMDEMELEELCEIVEAATFSSGDAAEEAEYIDATFISALASTAQTLVGSKVHDVSSLSRFSCALARANIAPSPQLLNLIVSSSAAHVKAAKDGLSSASSSHRSIALLLWGVSQLARNTSMLLPSGPDAGSFVDQKWLDDIIVCINRTITSSRAPFTLDDLARIIWAFATLNVQPRRETVNSFIGKSIDRLSSLESDSCLNVIWALSSLGYPMLEKWLNQWAIRAMPALGTLEVRPQTLAKVISAIQYHHSTSSSLPSSHLMRALINLISNNLRHKTERANVPCSALLLEGSISAALCLQEPNLASPQVVQIMTSLSSLGVSNVMQDGESKGFCSLLFSVIDLDKISTPLVLDALVAVSVMVDVKVRPAGKDKELSDWMVKAARALPLTDLESKANDAARLLSSLAVLSAFVERESIVQVSEVIEASSANLMIKEDGVGVADGLTLPNAVDAMWGLAQLSSLQLSLPPSQAFVTSLTSYLDGKIGILNATQLKRLISGLSSPSLCYQPSSSLALELSRAAVSRFSSSSVPASELADVVWNFAVLSCDLPPSFAASAQRRLQAAMKDLDAPSLAKMMWSLAKSNYLPSEPQLRAYASRVTAVLDGMIKLEDLSRSLEAFVLFNHRLDHNAVVRAVAISLPLLSEAGDVKRGSTIASLARSILWHANGSTVLTDSNQWVKALTSALDSQALDSLTSSEVCSLLSTLARVGPSEESKDGFDILKLLSRLPATSDLNAMNCQDLVKVMSIWKESLSPNDPNTLHVVKDLPVRIQQKLAAYSATDSAALLTSLTTLASSTRLLPLFERTTLTSLMGDLAAKATGAIPALSTSDVALLVAAVSQSRAVMLSSSSSVSADLTDDRVTDLLTLSLTRIKDDLDRLRDQDLVMLMEALSRESEEAAGLRSRMVKNGRKAPEASALQVKKDQELRALVRRISVVLGEVMASERRLSAMQPEMFARFIGSYCKHLKFGSYSLLLTKEEEEEEKRREKGEVAAAHNGIRGPSEPRQVLESSLNVMRARMESGSLAGWEHVAIIARAIASSGAVPSAAWIGAMKQAVRITQAPEPGPATSLLYSFVCWQADPGRDFASLLLAGAFRLNSSSPAPDPSLVLLGYSHCSTFGYRVDNEVILNEFVSNRLIPSLPAMNAEQIATVATSLSSFKGSQNLRDEIRAAVDQALVSVDWDVFSSHLIAQVALNLIAVRNNRSGGVHWISAALDSVRGRKDGAIAVKHLQDLQSLQ